MKTLNIKIQSFDDLSQSLLVSFSTSDSKHPVDQYPAVAFQPYNFLSSDPNEIVKFLSRVGLDIATNQDKKEAFQDNVEVITNILTMIGNTYEVPVPDIEPPPTPSIPLEPQIVPPKDPILPGSSNFEVPVNGPIPPEVISWLQSQLNGSGSTGT